MKIEILKLRRGFPHRWGAMFILASVMVFSVGFILVSWQGSTRAELERSQARLSWLQFQQKRVAALRQHLPDKKMMMIPVQQVLARTSVQHEITLSQQKQADGQFHMLIERVPFNDLLAWLDQLKQQYAIEVLQIKVTALAPGDGDVKVDSLSVGRLVDMNDV